MRKRFGREGGRRVRHGEGAPPQLLVWAHELMDSGDYDRAAEALEQLAPAVERRGGPRAPMLFLLAGRARILAGQAAEGVAHLKKGLEMLAERGRWSRFQRAGQRAVAELNQRGMSEQAKDLENFLTERLPEGFSLAMAPGLARRPLLPTRCPACGGIVEPDEVTWIDQSTAECDYCGSPLRAQG